jgi:anti-sigma-K factor RskA
MSDAARDEELMASAAAWVLNALPDDEAAAFEAELATNAELREEVERLRPVADLIALAAPSAEPPPGLQSRIMAIVEREADLLSAAGPEADRVATPAAAEPARAGWLRRVFARPLIPVLTACVVAVAIGLGVGIGISGGGSGDVDHPVTFVGNAAASGELVTHGDSSELKLTGLKSPGPGHVYQAWVMKGGKVTPDNVFTVNRSGQGSVALRSDLDGAKQVLISVEPEGGSQQPTTTPIASTTLS